VIELLADERALLDGDAGPGAALAMRIVLTAADAIGAPRLRSVTRAHVDGCLYHGRSSLDFVERLSRDGARVTVPTTLNVGLVDLLHPGLNRGDAGRAQAARALMEGYTALGCKPTFTCAPYQLPDRPALGEHIAWAESNAIVFANSVLGARTNRYGDLIDIAAAITGRVPDAGLHCDERRAAQVVFDVSGLPPRVLAGDTLAPLLGHHVGARCGDLVPAIVGLPADTDEDALKALGAAAASSGAVGLFHAVGITPEAATLADALRGREPERTESVTMGDLETARAELGRPGSGRLAAVSVGTPHASPRELRHLAALLDGLRVSQQVAFYVCTHRAALEAEPDAVDVIEAAGANVVVDTCTYFAPIMDASGGVVMTNSAKWAYYAPSNLGVEVAFGSWADCVRSAVAGELSWEPLA
jgi:predicted aconitase